MSALRAADFTAVATLEQLDPELMASGRVILIGLEAVSERLGDRWERRRDQVWAHVEGLAARMLEPGDIVRRVSDLTYIVAFGSVNTVLARSQALQLLGEVLTHYLGNAPVEHLKISTVTGLGEGEIWCEPVPQAHDEPAASTTPDPEVEPDPAPSPPAPPPDAWRVTAVRSLSGRELKVASWGETLRHVRMAQPVGLRIAREITELNGRPLTAADRDALTPVNASELDLATLSHVRDALERWGDRAGFIVAPVSFRALASGAARLRLLEGCRALTPLDRARLIVELEDVEIGVPVSRIVETVGYLQSYTRGVVVRSSPVRASVERLRDVRVLGVALDAAGLDGRPGEIFGRLALLSDRSRGVVPDVFALGLPSEQSAAMVTAACGGFYSVRPTAGAGEQTAAA